MGRSITELLRHQHQRKVCVIESLAEPDCLQTQMHRSPGNSVAGNKHLTCMTKHDKFSTPDWRVCLFLLIVCHGHDGYVILLIIPVGIGIGIGFTFTG